MRYQLRQIADALEMYIINLGVSQDETTKMYLMDIIYWAVTGYERSGACKDMTEDSQKINERLDKMEKNSVYEDFFYSGKIYNLENRKLVEKHITCFIEFMKSVKLEVYAICGVPEEPNWNVRKCKYDIARYFAGWEDTPETQKIHHRILNFLIWHERKGK